jgi:polar amino acid transport system substrate-binding protein
MRRTALLSAVLIAVLAAGTAFGATLDTIKQRGLLTVGVKADFPPFGFIDERGQQVGFDIDLAHEVAGIILGDPSKVRLVTVTSANRIAMLQTNQVDTVMASMTITAERRQVIDFTVPYFCSGHLILVEAANTSITNFADLNGKKVSTVQGATGDRVTSILAPRAQRITFGQNSEALLALKDGRTDAFVQDDVLLLAFAKRDPSLKVVGWPPQMPGPYGIGVRTGDRDLLGAINVALARLRTTGVYNRIVGKWFGEVAGKLLAPSKCPPELRF